MKVEYMKSISLVLCCAYALLFVTINGCSEIVWSTEGQRVKVECEDEKSTILLPNNGKRVIITHPKKQGVCDAVEGLK